MYDTITISNARNTSYLKTDDNLIRRILQQTGHLYSEQSDGYTGKYKNILVIKKNEVIVLRGSLAKLFYGDNLRHLHFSKVKELIDELSTVFHLSFDKAHLSRIDIGYNLPVNGSPEAYLECLTYARGYKQELFFRPHAKYFIQTEKRMLFYNKIKEIIKHNPIPMPKFGVTNILRYELRLFNPGRELGIKNGVLVEKLWQAEIANKLSAMWVTEYFKITKNRLFSITQDINSQRDFSQLISLLGCEALGGESALYGFVDALPFNSSGHPQKIRGDIFRVINGLYSGPRFTKSPVIHSELDNLILIAAFSGMG